MDAAEFKDSNKVGLGVIARGKEGGCKVCESLPMWFPNKTVLMEAWAVLEGLKVAMYHCWELIIIENDCNKIVDDLEREVNDLFELGPIYTDIRELKPHFRNCCIAYVSRKTNNIAHRLVKWAQHASEGLAWFDTPPPFLQDVMLLDSCSWMNFLLFPTIKKKKKSNQDFQD